MDGSNELEESILEEDDVIKSSTDSKKEKMSLSLIQARLLECSYSVQ